MSRTPKIALAAIGGVGLIGLVLYALIYGVASSADDAVVPPDAPPALNDTPIEMNAFVASDDDSETTEPTPEFPVGEREAITGPRGRVVMLDTGKPVAGVPVIMRFGSKELARTVSDADGHFSLPEPKRKGRRVQLDSNEWRAGVKSIRLDEAQSSGETPLLFEVEFVHVALIRGRLVDPVANEPVPDFRFELFGPIDEDGNAAGPSSTRSRLTTDAEGRFVSRQALEAGRYGLLLFDLRRSSQSNPSLDEPREAKLVHQLDDIEQDIPITIGPTYHFEGELPEGLDHDDFVVSFSGSSRQSRAAHDARAKDETGILSAGGNPLFGAYMGERPAIRAHLRDGPNPWARFREPIDDFTVQYMLGQFGELPPDWSLELRVRSNDGQWVATTTVNSTKGIYPRKLPLKFEPQGSLRGEVVDENGKVLRTAWIIARPSDDVDRVPTEVGVDKRGAFELESLAAGEWTVRVEAETFTAWEGKVTIVPFEANQFRAQLTSNGQSGSISGTLKSRTGKYRPRNGAQIILQRLDADAAPDFRMVRFRRSSDGRTADFEFERVPAGEYELSIETTDNYAWNHRSVIVRAPANDIEFICEDEADTRDLELRPVDAQSGAAIEPNWAMLWVGEPTNEQLLDRHWDSERFEAIPQDHPYRWLVRAKGYRFATGDESAFRLEDDLWVLDVELVPGWGQAFRVTTDTKRPLAGVALFADGERIGVTDAHGLVLLDLESKPQELHFELDGWRYEWGRIDPSDDNFGWGVETAVHMERE